MSNDNQLRTGLWKNEPGKPAGYGGKIEIEGKWYWVNLYKNERKESDKHPDLNLVMKPKEAPAQRQESNPSQNSYQSPSEGFDDDLPPF